MPSQKAPSSMLSFVPEGIPRTIAEHLVAIVPGSILLLGFFFIGDLAAFFVKNDLISIVFLPVICFMPLVAGAASALVLEKVSAKPLSIKSGAIAGAAAAFVGSSASALLLLLSNLLLKVFVFGSAISGVLLLVALFAVVAIDTLLGALGGALVAKFLSGL